MSARSDDDRTLSLFAPEVLGEPRERRARPAKERAAPPADHEPPLDVDLDRIPDVRDGLTRVERVILYCMKQCEAERPGRMISTAMIYGRVVEHVDVSVPEFQRLMQRLVGVR